MIELLILYFYIYIKAFQRKKNKILYNQNNLNFIVIKIQMKTLDLEQQSTIKNLYAPNLEVISNK